MPTCALKKINEGNIQGINKSIFEIKLFLIKIDFFIVKNEKTQHLREYYIFNVYKFNKMKILSLKVSRYTVCPRSLVHSLQ